MHGDDIVETPEFIRWAIEQPCPLREHAQWQNPERAERQLRPLRVYAEAVADGRCFEGICFAPNVEAGQVDDEDTQGFRADEILAQYGGLPLVRSLCGDCRANTLTGDADVAIAGCHGSMAVDARGLQFRQLVERAAEQPFFDLRFGDLFPRTQPRWYGFWMSGCLMPLQSRALSVLFDELEPAVPGHAQSNQLDRDWIRFGRALRRSGQADLPIRVELSPRGQATALTWTVAAHCPRCRASRRASERQCRVCGQTGGVVPRRQRHVRGDRPYWPLKRFLGLDHVAQLLNRYREFRHRVANTRTSTPGE